MSDEQEHHMNEDKALPPGPSTDGVCPICGLYRMVDRWLDESKVGQAFDNTEDTNTTLEECAVELASKLPPRGHAFHDLSINWAARVLGDRP